MKWRGRRQSGNVTTRRGMGRGVALGGGGIVTLIAVLLAVFLGGGGIPVDVGQFPSSTTLAADQEDLLDFVSVVLADTEDAWTTQFEQMGRVYEEPQLVVFEGSVSSACGFANSAVGPFYCPGDKTVYIDLGFYDQLRYEFQAPGDFAQAYVIAHEVGHHVQNLLGTMDQVDAARSSLSEEQMNELSVRLELQADFYAGLWAHYADQVLGVVEPGDVQEAIDAATAIGDDRLQLEAQGYVVPDSFTHGTSEQRARWFNKGYQTGDITQGDTFSAGSL
jgi:predicted metalloprotease